MQRTNLLVWSWETPKISKPTLLSSKNTSSSWYSDIIIFSLWDQYCLTLVIGQLSCVPYDENHVTRTELGDVSRKSWPGRDSNLGPPLRSGALTTEPPGCGVVPAYYPCGWFSIVTDTTRLGTGCDCMSTPYPNPIVWHSRQLLQPNKLMPYQGLWVAAKWSSMTWWTPSLRKHSITSSILSVLKVEIAHSQYMGEKGGQATVIRGRRQSLA